MKPSLQYKQFPCQQCGAFQEFDAIALQMNCPHCDDHQDISASLEDWKLQTHRLRLEDNQCISAVPNYDSTYKLQDISITHCAGCGAHASIHSHLLSTRCNYCHAPIVRLELPSDIPRVDALVPFMIKKNSINKRLLKWLGLGIFTPHSLKQNMRQSGSIQKLYMPFWKITVDAHVKYKGRRQITDDFNDKYLWLPAKGELNLSNEITFIPADDRIPPDLISGLGNWPDIEAMAFQPEFLAGTICEIATVGVTEAWNDAVSIMDKAIYQGIMHDIGGDNPKVSKYETQFENGHYQQVLMPIYQWKYHFQNKLYEVYINGITGEISGEKPLSFLRTLKFIASGIIVLIGLVILLSLF